MDPENTASELVDAVSDGPFITSVPRTVISTAVVITAVAGGVFLYRKWKKSREETGAIDAYEELMKNND